ncbi:MarR family transcriptional regulator [Microbacterium sp. NPDC019599]|uniref:GbsR/MarR family transcriptional regulator n=1 Tax=Microbacterium sp. NPDC019599 TaxID=3154690 RepID=UPI0033EC234F
MVTGGEHSGAEAAEQAASLLTAAGMARMPSRVMMALVGSPDDGYTAAELADRLGVSPAAVSGAVRYLQSIHMIRRISRPGDRRDRYELSDDAWSDVATGNAPLYTRLADFMDLIADDNDGAPASVARARATADFLRFLATRMPELVEEWRVARGQAADG